MRTLKTHSVLLVLASIVGTARVVIDEQRASNHGVFSVGQEEAEIHVCLMTLCESVPQ